MARPFVWFGPASVAALKDKLNAASPDARLEVHEDAHGMTLFVVEPGDVVAEGASGGVNESHTCPPICP